MPYKELKEQPEQPTRSNGVAYAEIITALLMAAMTCGTIIITTQMWIQERQSEVVYLRANP